MRRVIEERGAEMADVPGGSSGLLVKTYKGKDAATAVYKFDAALVKGLRETCKQVAIEIGQWAEKRNVTLEREAAGKSNNAGPVELVPRSAIDVQLGNPDVF
jgi:hypothetical protein